MQNIINFKYQTPAGRPGEVTLNLDMIIPASAANFKKVMSFIDMALDQETPARVIYDYIAGHVDALKKARELAKGTPREKEETAKLNTEMKRYITNAAPLVQAFSFPEITDKDATIKMLKATVYALQGNRNRGANADMAVYDGWTFEKGGILFDVYQAAPKSYIILYHGTGLQVASATNKTAAPAALDARIMGILTDPRGAGKIQEAKDRFTAAMIAAGYMDAKTETEQEPEPEPETVFQAPAVIAPAAPEPEPETETEPETAPEPETETELDIAAGPLYGTDGNSKHFIGTVITGRGWKIRFTAERTAVIFDRMPPVSYRNAVKAAGFKWAPAQKSWNKGATWKAYRAALQLAEQLKQLAA